MFMDQTAGSPATNQTNNVAGFDIGTVLSKGWEAFKPDIGTFVVATLIWIFVPALVSWGAEMIFGKDSLFYLTIDLLTQLASLFFAMGLIKMSLDAVKGAEVSSGTLFKDVDKFVGYLALNFIMGMAVVIGILFFIVPGIYLAIRFMFAPYLFIDGKAGVMDSFKLSGVMTSGVKIKLFILGLLFLFIVFLGFMALGIGFLVAFPYVAVASAMAYQLLLSRINQRTQEPAVMPTS